MNTIPEYAAEYCQHGKRWEELCDQCGPVDAKMRDLARADATLESVEESATDRSEREAIRDARVRMYVVWGFLYKLTQKRIVPVEPTHSMCLAGNADLPAGINSDGVYRAMVERAPEP